MLDVTDEEVEVDPVEHESRLGSLSEQVKAAARPAKAMTRVVNRELILFFIAE